MTETAIQHDGTVVAFDPNHVTRQEAARRACEEIGITYPGTILPPGTALYASGVEKLKSDRASWARLPLAADALPAVREALRAEERADLKIKVRDLRLDPATGRLVRAATLGTAGGLGYDAHGFRQLVQQVPGCATGAAPRGFASALLHLTDAERAAIVNARIGTADADRTITVRTRLAHNTNDRVVRAFLSERYADVTDEHVAEAIELALNGDAQIARLDYKPGDAQSRFEVLYPSEIPVETFVVGDVHKAVVQVRNSETGQGSIRVVPGVIRAACANLTLSHGFGVEVALKHVGDAERIKGQMRAAIAQAVAQIEPLVNAITVSAKTPVPEGKSPAELLAALAAKYEIGKPRVEAWVETYNAKYSHATNAWGVAAAITDAAQTAPWWGAQQEEEQVAAAVTAQLWNVLKS